MKCRIVKRKLTEYLDAELTADERAAIAAHLETCAGCRAEASALQLADGTLRTLAAVETAPDLTADLRLRLAARSPRRLGWRWAGAGVVTVVIVSAALICFHSRPARVPQPSRIVNRPPRVEAPAHSSPFQGEGRVRVGRTDTRAHAAPHKTRPHGRVDKAPAPGPAAPKPLATEQVPVPPHEDLGGVILLVGAPEPPPSDYYLEVTHPDGSRSVTDQAIERDAEGRPRTIRIARQQLPPDTSAANGGS